MAVILCKMKKETNLKNREINDVSVRTHAFQSAWNLKNLESKISRRVRGCDIAKHLGNQYGCFLYWPWQTSLANHSICPTLQRQGLRTPLSKPYWFFSINSWELILKMKALCLEWLRHTIRCMKGVYLIMFWMGDSGLPISNYLCSPQQLYVPRSSDQWNDLWFPNKALVILR